MFDLESWYRYAVNVAGEAGSKAATLAKEGFHLYRLFRPTYDEEFENKEASDTEYLIQPTDLHSRHQQHVLRSTTSVYSEKLDPAATSSTNTDFRFSKDNLESAIANLPAHLLVDSGSIFEAAVQPGAYPSTQPASTLTNPASMISSFTSPYPSWSEEENFPLSACKEHCYYKVDDARVPGILTFTSEFVSFEPHPEDATVLKKGINYFQLYINRSLVEDFKWFLSEHTEDGDLKGGELTLLYNLKEKTLPSSFKPTFPLPSRSDVGGEPVISRPLPRRRPTARSQKEAASVKGTLPRKWEGKTSRPRRPASDTLPFPASIPACMDNDWLDFSTLVTDWEQMSPHYDATLRSIPPTTLLKQLHFDTPPASIPLFDLPSTARPPPSVDDDAIEFTDFFRAPSSLGGDRADAFPSSMASRLPSSSSSAFPSSSPPFPSSSSAFPSSSPPFPSSSSAFPSSSPFPPSSSSPPFPLPSSSPPFPSSTRRTKKETPSTPLNRDAFYPEWSLLDPVGGKPPTPSFPPTENLSFEMERKGGRGGEDDAVWEGSALPAISPFSSVFTHTCVFQFDDFAKADQALCWLTLFLCPTHKDYTLTKSKENDPFLSKTLTSSSSSSVDNGASTTAFPLSTVMLKSPRTRTVPPVSPEILSSSETYENEWMESTPPEEILFVPKVFFETPKGASPLLDHHVAEQIALNLPPSVAMCKWNLAFCPKLHGISFLTFYRQIVGRGPCLLLVRDDGGTIFGGFMEELRLHSKYYGSSSTFVFTFKKAAKPHTRLFNENKTKKMEVEAKVEEPQIRVFRWAMENQYFVFSDANTITIGGGGRFALTIDHNFSRGSSSDCPTFNNPCLASTEDFKVKDFQVWVFDNQ